MQSNRGELGSALTCVLRPYQPVAAWSLRVEVTVQRLEPQVLQLRYAVSGDLHRLQWPAAKPSQRRDELWRHTCAELFVAARGESEYCEYNFSPSGEWAAYRFSDYRSGMALQEVTPPAITMQRAADALHLGVRCVLPDALAQERLQAGLTLVVEDVEGVVSYWALHHPADKPDFHHRDGFVLEL